MLGHLPNSIIKSGRGQYIAANAARKSRYECYCDLKARIFNQRVVYGLLDNDPDGTDLETLSLRYSRVPNQYAHSGNEQVETTIQKCCRNMP